MSKKANVRRLKLACLGTFKVQRGLRVQKELKVCKALAARREKLALPEIRGREDLLVLTEALRTALFAPEPEFLPVRLAQMGISISIQRPTRFMGRRAMESGLLEYRLLARQVLPDQLGRRALQDRMD
jgi:hypothetical protein